NMYIITGRENFSTSSITTIDCYNSGTSVRIFSALALLVKGGLRLIGEFFKRNRPIKPLLEALTKLGAQYSLQEEGVIINRKDVFCKSIDIRGDISSQFITALLILLPLLDCSTKGLIEINITTKLVSYPYVKISLDILRNFGISIIEETNSNGLLRYLIETGQKMRTQEYEIPADFSSASFIIAAAALSKEESHVLVKNLDFQNPQGDKKIIEILEQMGAKIQINLTDRSVLVFGNISKYPLKGRRIDCTNIPDLFPILSVIGAFAQGTTHLYNAESLRFKESDRISVMASELKKMGVSVEEQEDGLLIHHTKTLSGCIIDHRKDHRIAMACAVAALYANSESIIHNIEIVKDSYPQFFEDLESLGAHIERKT
ncbi:MAG: 3-phosphoshikimate 1-carboxyvinyltransferase, partial [Candidatus Lokiarchaeota archaeon]|nr:3-phosphoshikimate 1-carboxyvinyltransferase [Candidatus Lokiarchaeota archaeon]